MTEPPFVAADLPLPPGYSDPVLTRSHDTFSIRLTEAILGNVCVIEATMKDLAEWQRLGEIPPHLRLSRRPLGEEIARLSERQEAITAELAGMRHDHTAAALAEIEAELDGPREAGADTEELQREARRQRRRLEDAERRPD